jgi:hypothetical protein
MLSFILPFLLLTGTLADAVAPQQQKQSPWPEMPAVEISWKPRGDQEAILWSPSSPTWIADTNGRHARLTRRMDDVAFIVWVEQFKGIDATRVTIGAINGFENAGPRYFESYDLQVADLKPQGIEGKHVILPRAAILRRFFTGPKAGLLQEWRYVRQNEPVPAWAVPATRKDTAERKAFPFRDQSGNKVNLGPYNFFWNNRSLEDSHGGWGVGPFHGGSDDWLKCPVGRKNRETEMMLAFQRPIWMLADDFSPLELQVAYWMGRTRAHEPAGYQYTLDNWCAYAKRLSEYRFADHTHLSRGTSGAAAIAEWDVVAVECLSAVLNDFKMAHSLTRMIREDKDGKPILHPGARQTNHLLFPLWLKVERSDGPDTALGDRGLGHMLRLLRWCRPFFPSEELKPWEDAMRDLVRALADPYGVTSAGNSPGWVSERGNSLSKPLVPPFTYTFHQQLVTYECQRFGGLDDIGELGARFLTRRPPTFFEVRKGKASDTIKDRGHSADSDQKEKKWAYGAYGNFTHDVLNDFQSPEAFLRMMKSRGVNGSSQDLDNTPRHVWESGLP